MPHRSGGLKQSNKRHGKLGHASKRSIKRRAGGRVERAVRVNPKAGAGPGTQESLRQQRQNQARQRRSQKKEELLLKKRVGSRHGPPKVVALLALSPGADCGPLGLQIIDAGAADSLDGAHAQAVTVVFRDPSPQCRLTLIRPDRTLDGAIEAARIADVVVLVVDMAEGEEEAMDDLSEVMLTLLNAQGLPTIVGVVQGPDPARQTPKGALARTTWAKRFFDTEFADARMWDGRDVLQLVRLLAHATPKPVHWRDMRSYLVADDVSVAEQNDALETPLSPGSASGALPPSPTVTLRVRGYVRGRLMSANRLVHVPNVGTFRLRRILAAPEPCPMQGATAAEGTAEEEVLAEASPEKAEPLDMEAHGDPLGGEQTWPTSEEYPLLAGDDAMDAEGAEEKAEHLRLFPKGMTDAQKAWFDFDDEQGHVFGDFGSDGEEGPAAFSDEELEEIDVRGLRKGEADDLALHVEDHASKEDMRMEELARRQNRAEEDREFPDEVDTPLDTAARVRFARYRALRSFRTSPWHHHEALPPAYARIHAFQDFRQVQKAVLDEMAEAEDGQNRALLEAAARSHASKRPRSKSTGASSIATMDLDDGASMASSGTRGTDAILATVGVVRLDDGEVFVPVGAYVMLEVVDLPLGAVEKALTSAKGLRGSGVPLVVSSLLPHENRLSVVHMHLQRSVAAENVGVVHPDEAIKSKDELRFVCGFRQWTCRPLFSEVASGASDKQRHERFLRVGAFTCASVIGPVCYSPCPVLVFRDHMDAAGAVSTELLATGAVDAVDPDRLIIKRILLTGFPVKAHKRSATVKYMFFNAADVRWFKPAELHTKLGLTGHVKESLGEQGLMKCVFNKSVKQHDTVCLSLYKRVFPKFPENGRVEVL